jgi:hypothetical protein
MRHLAKLLTSTENWSVSFSKTADFNWNNFQLKSAVLLNYAYQFPVEISSFAK